MLSCLDCYSAMNWINCFVKSRIVESLYYNYLISLNSKMMSAPLRMFDEVDDKSDKKVSWSDTLFSIKQ
jgi:hypothetical protein